MKNTKKYLNWLLMPISVGFYLTLFVTWIAFTFYEHQSGPQQKAGLTQILNVFHLKSIDFRLLARGERPGSDRVAILDIDDHSLEVLGRWPWSREKIAQVIDQVMSHEVSSLAFDITFAEEQENPLKPILQRLKQNPDAQQLGELLEPEVKEFDADLKFAKVIEKHADRLVMGSYYDGSEYYHAPWQDPCVDMAFSRTREQKAWENQGVPVIAVDEFSADLPEVIKNMLAAELTEIEAQAKRSFFSKNPQISPATQRYADQQRLQFEILQTQLRYCANFLTDQDPVFEKVKNNWINITEQTESLAGLDFESGMDSLKYKGLRNPVVDVGRWWIDHPLISQVTTHTATFNTILDSDGTIRSGALLARGGSTYVLPIALKAFLVAHGYFPSIFFDRNPKNPSEKFVRDFAIMDEEGNEIFQIPVDEDAKMRINYAGPRKMFPYISAAEFVEPKPTAVISQRVFDTAKKIWLEQKFTVDKKQWLKDKILLFGPSATGIFDLRVTPFEENYPGVETHANILDNLLRRDFLKSDPLEEPTMLLTLLGIGLVLSVLVGKLGALPGLIIALGSGIGVLAGDYFYFFKNGTVTVVIFPLFLIGLIYVVLTFYKYFTEERQKRELKGTFAKYVSPSIVEEILADPSNIELGGRKQRVTVFFSDVRGFTTISEKLDPRALSDLLNSYLTPMTDLVFKHKGTLDKYMGDAIMAFFGAPVSFPDHAKYACRCALAHLVKLKELQAEYRARNLPEIDIGIGLNTGDVSVGNMGSETVRSYTVMGDAVNLGSRLEGITKEYGTRIVISEFTYADVQDSFTCREIDWVKVKGKNEPVRIFELVCEGPAVGPQAQLLEAFAKGFDLYHQQKFSEAKEEFSRGLTFIPDDYCSKLYVKRCDSYVETPPASDWDGVYTMKTK